MVVGLTKSYFKIKYLMACGKLFSVHEKSSSWVPHVATVKEHHAL
jgi:hypothetical protein